MWSRSLTQGFFKFSGDAEEFLPIMDVQWDSEKLFYPRDDGFFAEYAGNKIVRAEAE